MPINVVPEVSSGIQLLMILAVVLMVTAVAPDLGVGLLLLAVLMWMLYNIPNLLRQY